MILRPVTPGYLVPSPVALSVKHFASGLSRGPDLRGFARILYPIGVSIPELSEQVLSELLGLAHLPIDVFVDSGAFSERVFDPMPRTVKPITEAGWRTRLGTALRIGKAFGARAWIVAPDCVGDQVETLRRMSVHRGAVKACADRGASAPACRVGRER